MSSGEKGRKWKMENEEDRKLQMMFGEQSESVCETPEKSYKKW